MIKKSKIIEATLTHELVVESIDVGFVNWTRSYSEESKEKLDKVRAILVNYAKTICKKVVSAEIPTVTPQNGTDWREQLSDHVAEIVDLETKKNNDGILPRQLFHNVAEEIKPVLPGHTFDIILGPWAATLACIANAVGCVSCMIANDLDPLLLDERHQRKLA